MGGGTQALQSFARSCGRQIVNDRAGGMIEMVSEWSGTRYYVRGAKDLILYLMAEVAEVAVVIWVVRRECEARWLFD
jgi:hypothetical protein